MGFPIHILVKRILFCRLSFMCLLPFSKVFLLLMCGRSNKGHVDGGWMFGYVYRKEFGVFITNRDRYIVGGGFLMDFLVRKADF